MAEFSNLLLTERGREIVSGLTDGSETVSFTKICTSSAKYTEDELAELEDIGDVVQSVKVNSVTRTDETTICVGTELVNTELTNGYYLHTMGVYAVDGDGDECLFAVCAETSGNCYIPPAGGAATSTMYLKFYLSVGNSGNITIETGSSVYVTADTLETVTTEVQEVQETANEHIKSAVTSESGIHGIRYYDDTIQCYDEESESWEDAAGSTITDDTTGEKYKLGIDNGLLYYEAVEEEEAG